ncbi:MAG: NHLP leader peptide family natural product precursor [Alphaproteobacteria bacterium]|nr:NHLP leader peptide family natural product precursor [Alphaproteobacteria bacterium]
MRLFWFFTIERRADMIDRNDFQRAYGKVVARAWSDPDFKALLLKDARTALASVGVEYPADIQVHVRENNATEMNLVLPPQPAEGELSEEEIDQIASGSVVPCYIIPTKGRWQLK